MKRSTYIIPILLTILSMGSNPARGREIKTDLLIYGGTAAAVVAAIQADAMGTSVLIVCPDTHLGGVTSSGLGWTDSKNGRRSCGTTKTTPGA